MEYRRFQFVVLDVTKAINRSLLSKLLILEARDLRLQGVYLKERAMAGSFDRC